MKILTYLGISKITNVWVAKTKQKFYVDQNTNKKVDIQLQVSGIRLKEKEIICI